jgi:hypothetical protein
MLRSRLTQITEQEPVSQHAHLLEELHTEVTHDIQQQPSAISIAEYTCAVHAFDLVGDERYVEIASSLLGRTFAGKGFIDFLLHQGMLTSRDDGVILLGDLIIYFCGHDFRHIGRVVGPDRVLSKWGRGLLVKHGLWEVPEVYGNRVEYFVGLDKELSFALFQRYAESHGFTFK